MKIKTDILNKLINESIREMKRSRGFFCEDRICIHEEEGLQVHVLVTSENEVFIDGICKEYAEA